MSFRVTPQLYIAQALTNAQLHTANLADLQRQASSGLRIEKPSDDPQALPILLANKTRDARYDVELANMNDARTVLNLSVTHLLEVNDLFVRAGEIALQGNQAFESSERAALAGEVDGLLDNLIALANSQHEGRYLFSGTAVDVKPFAITASTSPADPLNVQYLGSGQQTAFPVGPTLTVDALYSGADVFQQRDRQQTLFIGTTGATSGSGTDSATGQGILRVRHTVTSYAAGSGVQTGASSAAGDTIIGAAGTHVLTIDDTSGTGASGTVSLNGGLPIAFTSANTDLQVIDPQGNVVYVDMSTITAGFSGNVEITAGGTLSVDGGVTEVAIDFSANQVVSHDQTGAVTNVDSSNIRQVGSEYVEYAGTADAFQALIALRDDLRDSRDLSQDEWHAAMTRHISDLARVRETIMQTVGQQSATLANLDSLENHTRQIQLETQKIISDIESADITQVIINLQEEQNLLQSTFATTAALFDLSLLDFLR
jgi:flagellar hook-associated protein 3